MDPRFDARDDLLAKLKAAGEPTDTLMRRMSDYRQVASLCVRVLRSRFYQGEAIAIDDLILERTYLLPRRGRRPHSAARAVNRD